MSLRNRFKLGLQFRLLMSQGCSILVLMVKNYQEGIYRGEANPSPSNVREGYTPGGRRERASEVQHLL